MEPEQNEYCGPCKYVEFMSVVSSSCWIKDIDFESLRAIEN